MSHQSQTKRPGGNAIKDTIMNGARSFHHEQSRTQSALFVPTKSLFHQIHWLSHIQALRQSGIPQRMGNGHLTILGEVQAKRFGGSVPKEKTMNGSAKLNGAQKEDTTVPFALAQWPFHRIVCKQHIPSSQQSGTQQKTSRYFPHK